LLTLAFHGLTSARPNPSAARPAIGAHTRRPAVAQASRQAAALAVAVRHTGCRNGAQPPRRRAGGCRVGEMRVGEGGRRRGRARRRRETALRACRGGVARRGGAVRRRSSSRWVWRGEAVTTTTEEERRGGDLGKQLSADLEGDEGYIEPSTFCHGSYSQL
jgi:hypothetical protein